MGYKPSDARQTLSRDILQELYPFVPGQQLDVLLRSINAEVTSPLKVEASNPNSLVVNVGSAIVVNSVAGRNRSIPQIQSVIPTFTSGTVTFPSSNGGTITVSPGTNTTLNCPSNNYVQVLFSLNSSGNIIVTVGTPNPVLSSALVPANPANTLAFAYITIFNNAGTVQNIAQSTIYQLVGGGSGSSSGTAYLDTENAQTGTTYTFALADGSGFGNHPYVSFNNASAVMVTVPANSSVAFPIGTEIPVISNGNGAVTLIPDVGVTIKSLNGYTQLAGKYAQATLIKSGTDTWYLYGELIQSFIIATGGTITTDGNFKVHTFTSSGTFQVLSGSGTVASLVVGGGGGGGNASGIYTGGGGAGGLIYTTPGATYGVGSYTVTVGAGGTGQSNGSNSVFDTITAIGGGFGGDLSIATNGASGGSGGGGGAVGSGGAGTIGQGFAGGNGANITASSGGGGGGSGGIGSNADATGHGNGGLGTSNSITGSAVFYASGGGGGSVSGEGGTAGTASAGGGGAGSNTGIGVNGTANTGGGGGGGSNGGSTGGSGIVIVRYQFQ